MKDYERKYIVIEYESLKNLAEKLRKLVNQDHHSHIKIVKDNGVECLITYVKEKRL